METWIKYQILFIERRFGRKLTKQEKKILTEQLKKQYERN